MIFMNAVTSVERVVDFVTGDMPQEAEWRLSGENEDAAAAAETVEREPRGARLQMQNMSFKYRRDLPFALQDVNIDIAAGERVGIVGRSGAGKSSLMLVLQRIVPENLVKGRVMVGDVDVHKIGLHTARGLIGVIPQTPLLLPREISATTLIRLRATPSML